MQDFSANRIQKSLAISRLKTKYNFSYVSEASEISEGQSLLVNVNESADRYQGQLPPVNYNLIKIILRICPELISAVIKKVDFSLGSSDSIPYKLISENEDHKLKTRKFFDKIDLEDSLRTAFFQLYMWGDLYTNMIDPYDRFSIISAETMRLHIDEFGNVENYLQVVQSSSKSPLLFLPNEIIHRKFLDLGSEVYGYSFVESLATAILRLLKMENFNSDFFANNGTPKGSWAFYGISQSVYKKLILQLQKAKKKPHSDITLYTPNPNGKIEYTKHADTMKDMEFIEGLKYQQMKIVKGTGVPLLMMGDPEGSNRATGFVQFYSFMLPIFACQRIIADILSNEFIPRKLGFDDVQFVFPQVDIRTPSEKTRDKSQLLNAMGMTAQRLGLVLQDGTITNYDLIKPLYIKFFELLDIPFDFSKIDLRSAKTFNADVSFMNTSERSANLRLKQIKSEVKRQPKQITNLINKLNRKLINEFVNIYTSLEPQILKILEKNSKAIEQSKYESVIKKVDNTIDNSLNELNNDAADHIETIYENFSIIASKKANKPKPGTQFDKKSINFLKESKFSDIKGVNDEIKKKIGFEVAQSIRLGESISQISKRIKTVINLGKKRLDTVARSIVSESMIEAEYNEFQSANIEDVDILLSGNENTCEICIANASNNPHKLSEIKSLIPAHPNCECDMAPSS